MQDEERPTWSEVLDPPSETLGRWRERLRSSTEPGSWMLGFVHRYISVVVENLRLPLEDLNGGYDPALLPVAQAITKSVVARLRGWRAKDAHRGDDVLLRYYPEEALKIAGYAVEELAVLLIDAHLEQPQALLPAVVRRVVDRAGKLHSIKGSRGFLFGRLHTLALVVPYDSILRQLHRLFPERAWGLGGAEDLGDPGWPDDLVSLRLRRLGEDPQVIAMTTNEDRLAMANQETPADAALTYVCRRLLNPGLTTEALRKLLQRTGARALAAKLDALDAARGRRIG